MRGVISLQHFVPPPDLHFHLNTITGDARLRLKIPYYWHSYCSSNRSLEITRTNGDKLNNGFAGEATNLLRSLINNRQIGITAVDTGRISPQIKFYRDTQGTTMERTDCSILGNRTNMQSLESKVRPTKNLNYYIIQGWSECWKIQWWSKCWNPSEITKVHLQYHKYHENLLGSIIKWRHLLRA